MLSVRKFVAKNSKNLFCFVADGAILSEMSKIRRIYVRKEKIRISIGTWNINGDKNPALEHEYPSILDAWILDAPENLLSKTRKSNAIPTIGLFEGKKSLKNFSFDLGYVAEDYTKSMPDILAIGFQEICDLTAANMVSQR
jgi:hypothetical protein